MRIVRRVVSFVLVAVALFARSATEAQLSRGVEFRVNTYTSSGQISPVAASDASGNFVVVWSSIGQDGSAQGVFGQRYASNGAALGAEFLVNSYTTSVQFFQTVASDAAGDFVVVWSSYVQDGASYGIYAQRFASSGATVGGEFRVNEYTTSTQGFPAVAFDGTGSFTVVWSSYGEDGSKWGVFGRRYDSAGGPLGGEFRVNTYTTDHQRDPALAFDGVGNFVVVWNSTLQDGSSYGVFGQRFASSGAPSGGEFRVNTTTSLGQFLPSVAYLGGSGFVVTWQSRDDSPSYGIFGQRYDASGAPVGFEFRVNSYTSNFQTFSKVVSDSNGGFVVAWASDGEDGSSIGIFGQRYDSTGATLGGEFRANTYTTGAQTAPAIASDAAGNFVVAWQGNLQDGSSYGVYAQRLCPPLSAVSVSTTGSLSVCSVSRGGTATVTDTGGATNLHQWVYRTTPVGSSTPITGQTGTSYVIDGADFAGATPGLYYLFCLTTPTCGVQMFSTETIIVTVTADGMAPTIDPPSALATTQTLCQ